MIVFSTNEIAALQSNPDALRALAGQHDCWANEAGSIDPEFFAQTVVLHESRAAELRRRAAEIESAY